jgi:hypothetical protein
MSTTNILSGSSAVPHEIVQSAEDDKKNYPYRIFYYARITGTFYEENQLLNKLINTGVADTYGIGYLWNAQVIESVFLPCY